MPGPDVVAPARRNIFLPSKFQNRYEVPFRSDEAVENKNNREREKESSV